MKALSIPMAVLILLGGVLGCVPAPGLPTSPPPSGSLMILGSADEEYVGGMARAFELETGIKTEYVRLSAGEALATLKAQRAQPRFSVWWGGSIDGYIAANASGLLVPYQPRGSAAIPRQYRAADGVWTGIWVGALAVAVNPRVLAAKGLPEPASWADLANPIYAGEIAMGHPATSGTAYTMVATIAQLHQKNLDDTFGYLRALDHNLAGGHYETSGATTPRIVARGDAAIGVAFSHDIVAAIHDGAGDLKEVFPSEGTGYEIGGMALLKNAPQPDLAKRFMDWALTDRAQELGPLFTAYQIPTNPDAKVPQQSVRLSSIKTIDYDFTWAGLNRDALVDRFNRMVAAPAIAKP